MVNATGGQLGTSGARLSSGVVATTSTGAINITATPIFAVNDGINAQVAGGGSGGITIVAGEINVPGNVGILSSITGGTGNTSITFNGAITAPGFGGIRATSSSTGSMSVGGIGSISTSSVGPAISVTNSATSTSGDITINPSGTLNGGAAPGIAAQITNAANNGNIVVTPTGAVTGGNSGGLGAIAATTAGGGNVTVTTSNNVTAGIDRLDAATNQIDADGIRPPPHRRSFSARPGCDTLPILRGYFMTRSLWAIVALGFVAGVALLFFLPPLFKSPPSESLQLAAAKAIGAATAVPRPATKAPAMKQANDQSQESFPKARRAIVRMLKDPDAARFGRIFEGRGVIGRATICGEVNAKNGFGGYTGMTPFVYFPDDDRAELITDPVTLQMTREGIDAYFKDCRRS
ncbi:hypothetical protein IVB18_50075 (plasmid) [Bradyrhizobium sp. 186]|uniref:hypothetical protein n=1 Tax=Bradyrhizobium sp. 186 TaxID=2782654 RepID=UPI0020007E85|nr:hypothetical protein [Bradyrhizobium sp. 186]UPK40782.1 hypothetical protein IVB18_50075 [Bradyrhizobium sp. 186]